MFKLTLFEAFWFSLFEDVERPEFSLFDMKLLAVLVFDPPPPLQGESTMRELKTPGATGEGRTSSEQVGPLPKFTTPEGK